MVAGGFFFTLAPRPVSGVSFDEMIEMHGIRFHVAGTNDGSSNKLQVIPAGLEIDNSPVVREINGTVTGAEVADLNGDGSPEIYVYVASAGSGSYGSLVAYSVNRRKSMSEIYLFPLAEEQMAAMGYMGHDRFSVVDSYLVRRFPVYRDVDTNINPTGGMCELRYRLVPGEAGWVLKLDGVVKTLHLLRCCKFHSHYDVP